ncbi:MAG: hypothetical protein ACM3X6_06445 [Patescibacteria group bacterium]
MMEKWGRENNSLFDWRLSSSNPPNGRGPKQFGENAIIPICIAQIPEGFLKVFYGGVHSFGLNWEFSPDGRFSSNTEPPTAEDSKMLYERAFRIKAAKMLWLTDWTTRADAPLTEEKRAAWDAYRAALYCPDEILSGAREMPRMPAGRVLNPRWDSAPMEICWDTWWKFREPAGNAGDFPLAE